MDGTATDAPAPAIERPWLSSYPPHVPRTVDEAGLGTVADIFRESVSAYPDRPALESFGRRLTFRERGAAGDAVASWLQSRGLGRGDRVAIMLPNVLAYPAILHGVLVAGLTVVNVNPLYTARELVHQLNDSGARVLFVLENFGRTVETALPDLALDAIVLVAPGDLMGLKGHAVNLVSRHVRKAVTPFRLPGAVPFRTVVAQGRRSPPRPVVVAPSDVAFLQYTGGTTGVAKAAMLTHRNVSANVAQAEAWLASALGSRTDHVMVTALPLYHIFALTACGILMARLGACQLLIANPRDIPGLVRTLRTRPFTIMIGVNTLFNALLNHPEAKEIDFKDLCLTVAGGMALQEAVANRWQALTGKPIVEGYGLSETSPVACVNRVDIRDFTGTVGFPMPSTDVSIRSLDGDVLPPGERGEICVRGPQVMAGYWRRPDETARAMTGDGFFRTGDVGVLLPDGQVKVVDRIKDMVLVSGFNVYPNEVEEVLAEHPGVIEVAVIGVPDASSGEAVAAFVVRRDPSLTAEALRDHARARLTSYKVPRRIEFRDELPKTNVGKVLRRALREEAAPRGGGAERS